MGLHMEIGTTRATCFMSYRVVHHKGFSDEGSVGRWTITFLPFCVPPARLKPLNKTCTCTGAFSAGKGIQSVQKQRD